MKKHWKKRLLSGILACMLVVEYIPAPAFASEEEGLCAHHTFHTAECGYSPAVEGHECGHVHTEACYQEVTVCVHEHGEACGYAEGTCGHVCSQETGCVTRTEACQHGHDESCGYVEATPEQPCIYACTDCAEAPEEPSEPGADEAVEAVRALIEALPTLEEIKAMSMDEQAEVYNQVQKAYKAYDALTDDQKAQLPEAEGIFAPLFEYFNTLTAPASGVPASGTCGDNLTWELTDDGVLTISGSGAMNGYSDAYSTPWYSNLSDIQQIVIEEGVSSIGDYAFGVVTYPNVSSVTVPQSVTSLGLYAFGGNGIQLRYTGTMEQWLSLDFYFRADTWAAPGAVCSDGTILTLGFCGEYGVSGSPRYVLTGDGCMRIYGTGDMQFYKYLTNSSHWKSYNSSITSVVVEDGVTSIAGYSFDGCKNLTKVTLPDNLRSIGHCAFRSCTALKAIDIPSSVTYISSSAFESSGLESIVIPEGVVNIGSSCFQSCTALKTVTIPASVKTISDQAFYNCSALTDVYYGSNKLTWDQISVSSNNDPLLNAAIHYTDLCTNGHTEETIPGKAATCTEDGLTDGKKCSVCGEILEKQQTIPASHNFVNGVCSGCGAITGKCGSNLTYLLTSDGLLTITGSGDMYDFNVSSNAPGWYSRKDQITTVVVENGAASIGKDAFRNCSELTSVSIPGSVASIGEFAFAYCTSLPSLNIPEGVRSIGQYAFWDCTSMVSIDLPKTAVSIDHDAFNGCSSLQSVILPEGLTTITEYLFDDCSRLVSVTIPSTVTTIEGHAFSDCSSLASVTIPVKVTSIGNYAFSGCSSLSSVTIPGGVGTINSFVFKNCTGLTSLTLSEGITAIEDGAFYGCTGLSTVVFPSSLTSFPGSGAGAFSGCTGLTTIYFKGDCPWGSNEFDTPLTAYYPYGNTTWSSALKNQLGNNITWLEACINQMEHTPEVISGKAATCTETGLTEGSRCSVCGTVLVAQEEIPAAGHKLTKVERSEPTCEDDGVKAHYHCSKCGKDFEDENGATEMTDTSIPAKGHNLTKMERSEPTCEDDGVKAHYHCSNCGKDFEDANGTTEMTDTSIPAKGHNLTKVNGSEPTCEDDGVKAHYHCSNCGKDFEDANGTTEMTDTSIPAKGHSLTKVERSEPTCEDDGVKAHYHCSKCGKDFEDANGTTEMTDTSIPAKGHNLTKMERSEPSCTEPGVKLHYHCSVCGKNFEDENGSTELTDTSIPTVEHEWGEWEVTTPATAGKDGEETRKCANCRKEETRPLAYTVNRVELAGTGLENQSVVWIDGVAVPVQTDSEGNPYVDLPENASLILVTYSFNTGSGDRHSQYPTGMQVYRVEETASGTTVTCLPELQNLLQYSGCSIRIVGVKGIRMITSISKSTRSALVGSGLAGYKLVEYGTALCRASVVDSGAPMVLGTPGVKSNYAYKRGVADPIFKDTGSAIQYTNVLVGFTDEDCKEDIAMRPYIILEDEKGDTVTVYGGIVYRSIGYIAYQNRSAFTPGSAAYEYVWNIIHNVYGKQYDADYRK